MPQRKPKRKNRKPLKRRFSNFAKNHQNPKDHQNQDLKPQPTK
jgi:hypothetical protein